MGEQNEQICISSSSRENNSGNFLEAQTAYKAWGNSLRNRKIRRRLWLSPIFRRIFCFSFSGYFHFPSLYGTETLGLLFPVVSFSRAKPSGNPSPFSFQFHSPPFPSPLQYPIMEILPSVLTWLSSSSEFPSAPKKAFSDWPQTPGDFLDKAVIQELPEAVQKFVFWVKVQGLPTRDVISLALELSDPNFLPSGLGEK